MNSDQTSCESVNRIAVLPLRDSPRWIFSFHLCRNDRSQLGLDMLIFDATTCPHACLDANVGSLCLAADCRANRGPKLSLSCSVQFKAELIFAGGDKREAASSIPGRNGAPHRDQ